MRGAFAFQSYLHIKPFQSYLHVKPFQSHLHFKRCQSYLHIKPCQSYLHNIKPCQSYLHNKPCLSPWSLTCLYKSAGEYERTCKHTNTCSSIFTYFCYHTFILICISKPPFSFPSLCLLCIYNITESPLLIPSPSCFLFPSLHLSAYFKHTPCLIFFYRISLLILITLSPFLWPSLYLPFYSPHIISLPIPITIPSFFFSSLHLPAYSKHIPHLILMPYLPSYSHHLISLAMTIKSTEF